MTTKPKASVIIPTYNRPQFLKRIINCVLNQTYQDFEIVVIDDSPGDETEKLVKDFNEKRIKYIGNKRKTSIVAARNQGVRASDPNSEYVAFVDDDGELLPTFLEKTIKKLEERKDLVGTIPDFEHRFDDGTKIRISREVHEKWNTGIGNGSVLRKSLFLENGIWFDEKVLRAEDWDFGLRVLKNHKIESLPEVLHIFYHHPCFKESSYSTAITPLKSIDYFFQKHLPYFLTLDRKALSDFCFQVGRAYCRSGAFSKGRKLFLKAFWLLPRFVYIRYYLFWLFPGFAQNFYLDNLSHKILKIKSQFKKSPQSIIPIEVMRGKETRMKRIIKSNKVLHGFFYKLLRCNRYVFILQQSKRDTDSLFKTITIETCSICNRSCSFCPISKDKSEKRMMPDKLFDKILKELKKLNFRGDLAFSNYGEPLLDKRLEKFAKIVKKKLGSKITISTNGDFLTPERFRKLVTAGIDVFHTSQHDKEPSETIKSLFSQITPKEWKYISYEIVNDDSVTLSNRGGLVKVKTLYPFYCDPQHMIIRANGEVSFCCNDYYSEVKLGNVNEEKLIDIWNKPFYRQIRNEIKRGIFNLSICKRCMGILPPKL